MKSQQKNREICKWQCESETDGVMVGGGCLPVRVSKGME